MLIRHKQTQKSIEKFHTTRRIERAGLSIDGGINAKASAIPLAHLVRFAGWDPVVGVMRGKTLQNFPVGDANDTCRPSSVYLATHSAWQL